MDVFCLFCNKSFVMLGFLCKFCSGLQSLSCIMDVLFVCNKSFLIS